MSQSSDYYEHKLDEAQEREYALEDQIAKLKDRVQELEEKNRILMVQLEGINVSSPYHAI